MSTRRTLRSTLWIYLSLVVIALVWAYSSQRGWLRPLRNLALDARFLVRGPIESPLRVVYVDIDTRALRERGNFPWDRTLFAKICQGVIEAGGAKGVGIDVVFSNTGIPNIADLAKVKRGSAEFGSYLIQDPPVVLAASYAGRSVRKLDDGTFIDEGLPAAGARGLPPEMPLFDIEGAEITPPRVGLIDTALGETRRVPVFATTRDGNFLCLALQLARIHWGLERGEVRILPDRVELLDVSGAVARTVPLVDGQMLDINWFSTWQDKERNPRASADAVLTAVECLESKNPVLVKAGREFFADGFFKDAIVLIGPVDPLMQDLAPTPFDLVPVPKVGVHGNLLKTIVAERYIYTPPTWVITLITVVLAVLVAGLFVGAEGRRNALARVAAVLILVCYVGAAFYVFARHDFILPFVAPVGASLSAALFGLAARLVLEQKQKSRIKGLFGAYLAPAVVERMVDDGREPTLGGVEEEITAYFSDVQNFSTFSEVLSPTQLVELMNEYLTACTDIVQAEGGTLDKYIGDAVVAMYGAPLALPDHALRSCVAALRVQRRCDELREKWRHEAVTKGWPELVWRLRTRVGLNSGRAIVGNMGSASRFNYTMMGDTVNLAARMESGAKSWGVYTMCTEATRVACEAADPGRIVFRELGSVIVKGRVHPVPLHELVCLREDATERIHEAMAKFAEGLALFRARDWDGALAAFTASAALEPHQPDASAGIRDNPSIVYQILTTKMRANPPAPDWNGAHVMTDK